MVKEQIERFLTLASLEMPSIIDSSKFKSADIYDDCAVITIELPTAMTMDELQNKIECYEGMMLYYEFIPSFDTLYGHRCCAYSIPSYGRMFKINSSSDSELKCDTIYITLYDSAETMCTELQEELIELSHRGMLDIHRDISDVIQDFF